MFPIPCANQRNVLYLITKLVCNFPFTLVTYLVKHTDKFAFRWLAVEKFIEGLRIKVQALTSPEWEGRQRKELVPERVMTVKGLACMRVAKIGKDGKQIRDNSGELEWSGRPNASPSNARDLSFLFTGVPGKSTISVDQYYERSTYHAHRPHQILTLS